VTAYAFDGDYEAAMEAGCDDYVVKPVRKDNLLSVINKYLKITD
jgi:CheY-like chemotaxis protein